jgi:hypothetical protein
MYRGRFSRHVDVLIKIIIISFMVPFYPPNHSLTPSCFMFAWIALLPLVDAVVEFHKVTFRGGATFLDIVVENSESNPQSLLFDTGSTHTYLLNHKLMKDLPRAKRASVAGLRPKGYRKSAISPKSVVTADGARVDFAGFQGLVLEKWTSKNFTLGNLIWNQRFAVARLPPSEYPIHDPRDSGLIGASPESRFTKTHPQFGFIPRDMDKEMNSVEFFISSNIDKKLCVNEVVEYTPVVDTDFWLMKGGMRFGDKSVASGFKFLVDSGCGLIAIPDPYYSSIKHSLEAHGAVWEIGYSLPRIACDKVHNLPPIHIETESGFTITILPEYYSAEYFAGLCQINIQEKRINLQWMTFGEPLVRYLVTDFDRKNNRMGFCEAAAGAGGDVGTPLVRKTVPTETFSRKQRKMYKNKKIDPVVIPNPPRIPTHYYPDGGYDKPKYGNNGGYYRDDPYGYPYGSDYGSSTYSIGGFLLITIIVSLL